MYAKALEETDENFDNPDNETCSDCLRLFRDSDLNEREDGRRICDDCTDDENLYNN